MDSELTDQELAAIIPAVGSERGQGEAVVDELAVECAENCSHGTRIAKGRVDRKGKVLLCGLLQRLMLFFCNNNSKSKAYGTGMKGMKVMF